jgi:hypothetical protein
MRSGLHPAERPHKRTRGENEVRTADQAGRQQIPYLTPEMPMHKRILGRGLEVPAIGLGCMGISQSTAQPRPREDMITLIRDAMDRG